ncbi:Cysteine rich repeat-containing protein [Rhizobiales bacterium GAS113]|nr:Cysteine rich repeat-containing protein [Rhizobiales bacterium GAS113]
MLKTLVAAGAALFITMTAASAQQRAAMKACAADIKAQCAGVQPGEGRIKDCIKAHFSDLSAPCQGVLVKAAAIGKACAADVKKNCASVKPGGGRIEACMKEHMSDVSDPCKDALTQAAAGKT